MTRVRAYRLLTAVMGALFVLGGLLFVFAFFRYQAPGSTPAIPTGPVGHYFVAFTGCALVGWGGGLLGAARNPAAGRTVGTATALALVFSAVYRMACWVVGDYSVWLGDLPRAEAAILLILALLFVWLRPPRVAALEVA
jgi:hypothetical protein